MSEFWAADAWVDGRWQQGVRLSVGVDGCWQSITADTTADGAQQLRGPVIPSLVDTHSHAFQRAFVGLAERRDGADDFWSWRDRMYGLAGKLTPTQLRAIAAQLYLELLQGGYTHVCEFHYLQHQPDGSAYDDPLAMSWALADAAAEVGIGLTLLPVLYARSGFGQPGLRVDQCRFATDARWVWQASQRINAAGRPRLNAGVALHSLRAANSNDISALQELVGDADLPIHIHIAEQQQEVADCLAATGQRPLAWLCTQFQPDARWHLVHATHSTQAEIAQVAASGASVVICPGTEANLGDGLVDLPGWLNAGGAGVPISIGSDSQVTRGWGEELRWLEYGQRLGLQRRNVAADPPAQPSTAARLFEAARAGSAAPAGFKRWGLQVGARADFLVLDASASGLRGLPIEQMIDGLIFASPGNPLRDVFVSGTPMIGDGQHARQTQFGAEFESVMRGLWP